MPPAIDITGKQFGRLTAIYRAGSRNGKALWFCECVCGGTTYATQNDLSQGKTVSCGCYNNELRAKRAKSAGRARGEQLVKHRQSGTRLYAIWKSMRQRCSNPRVVDYKNYGERGISVCPEWDDFAVFRDWALSSGYRNDAPYGDCTIDRIDVNGDYCPENCRWVDSRTQRMNQRRRMSE